MTSSGFFPDGPSLFEACDRRNPGFYERRRFWLSEEKGAAPDFKEKYRTDSVRFIGALLGKIIFFSSVNKYGLYVFIM